MASEIKIHLQTYLNDVGIKASQAQIEQLAKKIAKANDEAAKSTDNLGGMLGRLPGPLGKLQRAIGGVGAQALAVISAFKIGWDIGNYINDKVIKPLFGIKDPIKELKKENKAIEAEWKHAVDAFDSAMKVWEEGWKAQAKAADEALQKIEDTTAAYLRMQQARAKVQAVQDDAALLGLNRKKFGAMAGAGSPEEATAAGKYYDILIAEEKSKQAMAKFDAESATAAEKQRKAVEAIEALKTREAQSAGKLHDLRKKQAELDADGSTEKFGIEQAAKLDEQVAKDIERERATLEKINRDIAKRESEKAAIEVEMTANEQARANIKERAQLEIDERKKEYDDYVAHVQEMDMRAAEEEWQREQEQIRKAVAAEQAERTRMEQALAAQRIDDLRKELAIEQNENRSAMSRQQAAESNLTTAWGYYRNQDRMQAVIDEKKAQEAAEAQWAKDFERLKGFRKDWRTAEMGSLSAADESVRQVALAKEEKEAADRAVIETAENTRRLADKLDELLQVKG